MKNANRKSTACVDALQEICLHKSAEQLRAVGSNELNECLYV